MTAAEAIARIRQQRIDRDRRVLELQMKAAVRQAEARRRAIAEAQPPSMFRTFVHWWGRGKRTVFYWTDRRTGSWRWRKQLREELALDVDEVREFRERMLEELRPGVYAEWSDPREVFA